MTLEQHQIEVKKLEDLESELTRMIIDSSNSEMTDKFFRWQTQRNVCNKGFVKFLDETINSSK